MARLNIGLVFMPRKDENSLETSHRCVYIAIVINIQSGRKELEGLGGSTSFTQTFRALY